MIGIHIIDLISVLTASIGIILLINRWHKVTVTHFNLLFFLYIFVYFLYTSFLFLELFDTASVQEFFEDLSGAFLPMFWIIIFYVLVENERNKKVAESDRNWQITFQSIGDAIITTDTFARIVKMNPVAEMLTGWKASDVTGKNLSDIFRTKNIITGDISVNPAETALATGKVTGLPQHTMLISRTGKELYISDSAAPIKDREENITGVVLIFRDITESYKSQERIHFHANLLKDVETGIYVLDNQWSFVYWNPFMTKLFGWMELEITGRGSGVVFRNNEFDQNVRDIISGLRKGESFVGEYKSFRKDNTEFTTLVKNTPLFDKNGKLIGIIGIVSDISARKKMETELRLKNLELLRAKEKAEESDRLKTAFLANLSHEVRTPVNGIMGFADLLKEKDLPEDVRMKYIDVIEQSSMRMIRIFDDLVDISKIEAGTVMLNEDVLCVNNLIDGIYNFYLPAVIKKGLEFKVIKTLENKNSYIIADAQRLEQILSNLVNNAMKFTEKGQIEIGYMLTDSDTLEFRVKDTGKGISPGNTKIIFERFRQLEPTYRKSVEGIGLGLAICKAFAEMMGGNIEVISEEGVGTEFKLRLPYKKPIL